MYKKILLQNQKLKEKKSETYIVMILIKRIMILNTKGI